MVFLSFLLLLLLLSVSGRTMWVVKDSNRTEETVEVGTTGKGTPGKGTRVKPRKLKETSPASGPKTHPQQQQQQQQQQQPKRGKKRQQRELGEEEGEGDGGNEEMDGDGDGGDVEILPEVFLKFWRSLSLSCAHSTPPPLPRLMNHRDRCHLMPGDGSLSPLTRISWEWTGFWDWRSSMEVTTPLMVAGSRELRSGSYFSLFFNLSPLERRLTMLGV